MDEAEGVVTWRFVRFGLLVTGKGEELFLPGLFRSLVQTGGCLFEVIRRISQLSPITSAKRKLTLTGTGKKIPSKDEEIGLAACAYLLKHKDSFVILIDDLEGDRRNQFASVYQRYRLLLDTILGPLKHRASVHFLTNMLEAYYFADTMALNEVVGTDLSDMAMDVETISHPKNLLKQQIPGFDEIRHGKPIVARLNVPHILSRRDTCAALRTIFAWCTRALGHPFTDLYRLRDGDLQNVTRAQLDSLSTEA